MRRNQSYLLFLIILVVSGSVSAKMASVNLNITQQKNDSLGSKIPLGQKAGRFDVAVLIGNRNYITRAVPRVEYAHRDLEMMKQYVIRAMGFSAKNIILEKDATRGTFETIFGNKDQPRGKLARFVRRGESRVFVYYVGHGAPAANTGEGYFVPVDADPNYISTAGYPVSVFYRNLKKLPAKELVVVLDTCFSGRTESGLIVKNISPALLTIQETAVKIKNGAVLASSQGNQFSSWYPEKQHSLYTYYFLKGLQGDADANKDRRVTIGELNHYLQGEVPYWAGRINGQDQMPKMEGDGGIVMVRYR